MRATPAVRRFLPTASASGRCLAVGVLSLAVVVLLGASPAGAEVDVCQPARDLLVKHQPQRVRTFVGALNEGLPRATQQCLGEAALAAADEARAGELAGAATQLLKEGKRADAQARATGALSLDAENEEALAVAKATKAPKGVLQAAAEGWDDFQKGSLSRLTSLAVAAGALVVVLMVAARLLAFLRPAWPGRTSRAGSQRLLGGGVVVTILASVGLVLVGAGVPLDASVPAARSFAAFVLAGACAVGVWLTAHGLATRLRVSVESRKAGDPDLEGSGHVLALLEQLGASPARGIERPVGPDVTALATALADVEGGVAKAVKSVLAGLTGWTPWRVSVDQAADGTVAVAVSRNGRSMGAAVIDTAVLDPRGTGVKADPHVFVAAFVLTILAESHAGFEGLVGATDWVTVGWQYVAATSEPARSDDEKALKLLAPALSRDPGNWLAQVDLAGRRWRKSEDAVALQHYKAWLDEALTRMPGRGVTDWRLVDLDRAPLRLRVLAARAAVAVNHWFAAKDLNLPKDEVARAITDFCQGVADLADTTGTAPLIHPAWLDGMKSTAAAMARLLTTEELEAAFVPGPASVALVSEWERLPRGPKGHYAWACTWASHSTTFPVSPPAPLTPAQAGVAELRTACADPAIAAWLHKDPQMAEFRNTSAYDEFRPRARTVLTDVEPFASRKEALTRAGLTTVTALASLRSRDLTRWMPVSDAEASRLVEAAQAGVQLMRTAVTKGIALEVIAALDKRGTLTRAELAALDATQRDELVEHLVRTTRVFVPHDGQPDAAAALATWATG